jgi:hypothetical protein
MSAIPSSAMPHAYVHDDEEREDTNAGSGPSKGLLIGGAVAAYLLYRILR